MGSRGFSPGQGSEGRSPPEADDIFLFHRLISSQKYHINFGNLDYMASERACLCEHMGWAQSHFSYTFTADLGRLLPLHVSWQKQGLE